MISKYVRIWVPKRSRYTDTSDDKSATKKKEHVHQRLQRAYSGALYRGLRDEVAWIFPHRPVGTTWRHLFRAPTSRLHPYRHGGTCCFGVRHRRGGEDGVGPRAGGEGGGEQRRRWLVHRHRQEKRRRRTLDDAECAVAPRFSSHGSGARFDILLLLLLPLRSTVLSFRARFEYGRCSC